ncbi:uncharacterized protein LOC120346818 [Styela clava]
MGKVKENQTIVEFFERVYCGKEQLLADPPMLPQAGTCYAFSSAENKSKKQDWRADGYRWRQNGAKNIKCNGHLIKKIYFNVFTGPKQSSKGFQRIAHQCQDFPNIVIVLYKGDHTIAGRFPHGNCRRSNTPFSMTRKSVLEACRNSVGDPGEIYDKLVTSMNPRSMEFHVSIPRNASQIHYLQKTQKKKQKLICEILKKMDATSLNTSFKTHINPHPDLFIMLYSNVIFELFSSLLCLISLSEEQKFTFKSVSVGKYESRALIYHHAYYVDGGIPIMFFIHKTSPNTNRDVIWSTICKFVPKLADVENVSVSFENNGANFRDLSNFLLSEPFSTIVNHLEKLDSSPMDAMVHLQCNALKLHEISSYFARRIFNFSDQELQPNKRQLDKIFASGYRNPKMQYQYSIPTSSRKLNQMIGTESYHLALSIDPQNISLCPKTRSFSVIEKKCTYVVALFPKEICTCLFGPLCHHIMACKISLGMIKKTEIEKTFMHVMSESDTNDTVAPTFTFDMVPCDDTAENVYISIENDAEDHNILDVSSEIVVE